MDDIAERLKGFGIFMLVFAGLVLLAYATEPKRHSAGKLQSIETGQLRRDNVRK